MAEVLPLSESELQLLESLVRHRVRFMVLSLERILASKTAANRPKDRRVIPVLRNVLRTLQARQSGPTRTRTATPRTTRHKPGK